MTSTQIATTGFTVVFKMVIAGVFTNLKKIDKCKKLFL